MPHEGQSVGPYQLVRKLGGGAFGEVWLARHLDLGVGRALKTAHAEGVLHRDLEPENILLTSDGAVKVMDFGLGKVQAEVTQSPILSGSMETKEGESVSGTIQYMSHEQQTAADPDPRDDLYALGIMGCELLTGGRPTGSGIARAITRAGLPQDLAAPSDKACDDREYRLCPVG